MERAIRERSLSDGAGESSFFVLKQLQFPSIQNKLSLKHP